MLRPSLRSMFALASLLGPIAGAQVQFTDVASTAGLADLSFGRGAAMVDLDGDGLLDIVAIHAGQPHQMYHQVLGGTFVESAATWGIVPDTLLHHAVLVADFDNDGDDDIYVISGGFVHAEPNQLLRNDLTTTGLFSDVSAQSVGGQITSQNFGGTTQDFDKDGDLDIFLTTSDPALPCVVLTNKGNNVFNEISASAGVVELGMYTHCSSGDFDNDGWADVAAGNLIGNNVLYRNQGNGKFHDTAAVMGVTSPGDNFGLVLEDFNNDGFLDLLVPKYNNLLPATHPTELYLSAPLGAFTNVSAGLGLTAQTDMGHNTGDLDGDGYPDIYIGTGHPAFSSPDLTYLVTPNGAGGIQLSDVSTTSGIQAGGDTHCHGMAIGDFDADGAVDIFVNNGGPPNDPTTLEAHYLLRGTPNSYAWASFELEGVRSNRSAIGAHLVATTNTGRQVHLWRRAGHGFGNTNSPIQRVGLGTDASLTKVAIHWPSGIVQTLLEPALAQVHQVVETGLVLAGPIVVGGQLDLDAVGPGNQNVELYYSLAKFQLSLPGFGQLELLPPLTLLGNAVLDLTGRGAASFPIPANPALAGLTVFVQGWFHDPVTFAGSTLSNAIEVAIL